VKNTRLITNENVPCWYELSWLAKETSILLRIHRDFARTAQVLSADLPMPQYFTKEFRFSKFSGDMKKDFGFDGTFVFKQENGEFIEFLVPVPRMIKYTDKNCWHCYGTKIDPVTQNECPACDGSGKDHSLDWHSAQAISASFNLFFSLAFSPEIETSAAFPQLMTISVVTENEMNGGSLGGYFGIDLFEWLKTFKSGDTFPSISEAMMTAGQKIYGKIDELNKHTFRSFSIGDGGIVLQGPGNACCVSNAPEHYDLAKKKGSRLGCSNVDSFIQQIELLVGLSALWDLAKKGISL
jgi:hypothetical protein